MTRKRAIFWAFAAVLLTVAACYLCTIPFYANCDEDGIRAMLEGRMSPDGRPLAYMVWVNVLVGYALAALYRIWPQGYGYDLYLLLCLAGSGVAVITLLLRRGQKLGATIAAACLAIALIGVTFSLTSAWLLAAGWLLLLDRARDPASRFRDYFPAMLFLILGALTRIDMFIHLLPLIVIASLPLWQATRAQYIRAAFALALTVAIALLALLWDHRWAYDGIADFWRFNTLRSELADFFNAAMLDDPALPALLHHAGWTREQFLLLNSWFFYDTQIYTVDSLQRLVDALRTSGINFRGGMPYPPMVDLQRYYFILLLAMPLLARNARHVLVGFALAAAYFALYMLTTVLYKLPPGYVVSSLAISLVLLNLYASTVWPEDKQLKLPRGLGILPLLLVGYILWHTADDARRYDRRVQLETRERADMLKRDDAKIIVTWGPMYVYARPFHPLPDLPGRVQLNGAAFAPLPEIRALVDAYDLGRDFEKQLCLRDDIAVLGNLDADRAVPELERFIADHYRMRVHFERVYDGSTHRLYRCRRS